MLKANVSVLQGSDCRSEHDSKGNEGVRVKDYLMANSLEVLYAFDNT